MTEDGSGTPMKQTKKIKIAELMAQCNPNAKLSNDMKAWEQMTPVGLECEIEITEEEGVFIARCPNPELASEGNTAEEALENLREALALRFGRE